MDIRRKGSKWQCRAKAPNGVYRYKSFHTKREAREWGRKTETVTEQIDNPLQKTRVKDLIEEYEKRVTAYKSPNNSRNERYTLAKMKEDKIGSIKLGNIKKKDIEEYRDRRAAQGTKMATIKRQCNILHHMFELAIHDWEYPLKKNPVSNVAFPGAYSRRQRRLKDWEEQALKKHASEDLWDFLELLLETTMRRGELLNVEKDHIDFVNRLLYIPETKTGKPRTIPLSKRALEILEKRVKTKKETTRIFQWSPNAVRLSWQRLKQKSGVSGLNLHDLRHEAISRWVERGLSLVEVSQMSGHSSLATLSIYTHGDLKFILDKMDKAG